MANIELTLTPASPTGSMIFTLGAPGAQGPAGTIDVGSVTTGAPGSSATIVNVGTASAAILDFEIPRGDVGAQGDKGDQGDQGDPGPSGVVYATAPLSYDSGTQTVSIDLSAYLAKSGGVITGDIQSNNGSGYRSWDGATQTTVLVSNYLQLNKSGAGGGALTVEWDGITFQSGKQTQPFLGLAGYATESWVTSGFYPLTGNPSAFLTDAPSDGSTYGRNNGAWTVAGGGGTWGSITGTLSDQTDLQTALDLKYDATNPSGFINAINGLQPNFNYSVTVSNPPAPDSYSVSEWDRLKFYFLDPVGGVPSFLEYRTDGVFKSDGQEMYPKRTGGSFFGKLLLNQTTVNAGLNIGQTLGNVPSSTIAGDVWILDNINFKSSSGTAKVVANTNTANTFSQPQIISTGTTATLPALRITNQSTTGVSLLVEDTTNPDVNSFVVDASGNLGVGVAVGYTASQKVEVVGNVKADGFLNGAGPVFTVKSVAAHAVGANTHDIFMSVGGSTYRLPAIFVSTP